MSLGNLQEMVGKIHVLREPLEGMPRFVKVAGLVEENTREYIFKYVYYDTGGAFYNKYGERLTRKKSNNDIIRSATIDEALTFHADGYRLTPELLENSDRYIDRSDPRFTITLGEVYINRMGLPILLQSLVHGEDEEDDLFFNFLGTTMKYPMGMSWNRKGNCVAHPESRYKHLPSMLDLIYQRI